MHRIRNTCIVCRHITGGWDNQEQVGGRKASVGGRVVGMLNLIFWWYLFPPKSLSLMRRARNALEKLPSFEHQRNTDDAKV